MGAKPKIADISQRGGCWSYGIFIKKPNKKPCARYPPALLYYYPTHKMASRRFTLPKPKSSTTWSWTTLRHLSGPRLGAEMGKNIYLTRHFGAII